MLSSRDFELSYPIHKEERLKFINFSLALGALLIHHKMYGCIKQIFDYNFTEPKSGSLLPKSIIGILELYIKEFDNQYFEFCDNMLSSASTSGNDKVFLNSRNSFIALVFLWTLTTHGQTIPKLPNELAQKKRWLEAIRSLKPFVRLHLESSLIVSELGLRYEKNGRDGVSEEHYPIQFLEGIESGV